VSGSWSLEPDGGFAIDRHVAGIAVVLSPRGDLDLATVGELERALGEAADSHELVVLDLRGVPFMDSSGLHTMIAADLRMRELGGRLVVAPGGEQIRRLLGLTGADGQLNLVDDPADVLADTPDSPSPAT
jgi:anti-sigma B factor antagonist